MDGHAATPTCMRETSIPIPKLLFCLVNFTESTGFHTVRSMQCFTLASSEFTSICLGLLMLSSTLAKM